MLRRPPLPAPEWTARWALLAEAAGIGADERLTVALSGGADSVLLLHLVAAARPRPAVRAVHVDHGLRGAESDLDARFCRDLCRALAVPLDVVRLDLDPGGASLEARARGARYRALVRRALETGHTTILTGHHADDALETLCLRWIRGSALPGLAGLKRRLVLDPARAFGAPLEPVLGSGDGGERPPLVSVVRPLWAMRRHEVRRLLSDRAIGWREDGSNADRRFSRARVRHGLLPSLRRLGGEEAVENLRAFGRAVEALEEELAGATAHLAWAPPPWARATRGPRAAELGGVVDRSALARLPRPLRRRVLWRLLVEGTGRAPGRALLERVARDVAGGRATRHAVPGGGALLVRARDVLLVPPPDDPRRGPRAPGESVPRAALQPPLPFPGPALPEPPPAIPLPVPGIATLPDGRRLSAEVLACEPGAPVRRSALEVELDLERTGGAFAVRFPAPGDRIHPLGGPGTRPLARFLADQGIPREERGRVPLVLAGGRVVWAAGVRPAEDARVRPATRRRVLLALHDGAPAPVPPPAPRAADELFAEELPSLAPLL